MKSKVFLINFAIVIFFALYSCEKTGPEGPAGESGVLKGSLVGFVTLYDEFGVLIADKSGVIVSVDGSSPALSATTNSSGRYQIDNIPTGTYDLIFSKSGYATYKSLAFSFVGGVKTRIFNATISQQTTTLITNLMLTLTSNTQMVVTCTVSPTIPTGYYRYIRIYYSSNPSVSSTNYMTNSTHSTSITTYTVTRTIDKVNFPSGTTLYVVAHGESYYTYGYMDLITGLTTHSTINPTGSNIASIVVP